MPACLMPYTPVATHGVVGLWAGLRSNPSNLIRVMPAEGAWWHRRIRLHGRHRHALLRRKEADVSYLANSSNLANRHRPRPFSWSVLGFVGALGLMVMACGGGSGGSGGEQTVTVQLDWT